MFNYLNINVQLCVVPTACDYTQTLVLPTANTSMRDVLPMYRTNWVEIIRVLIIPFFTRFQCALAAPCDPRVACHNLSPGYQCDPCPAGYTGSSGERGRGLEDASRRRQRCYDLNECAEGSARCNPSTKCRNTEVILDNIYLVVNRR